jgi:polysaccharide biosynthesis protein PslG
MGVVTRGLIAALLLCATASAQTPSPAPATSNPYGVLVEWSRLDDRAALRDTLTAVREAGIGWVRIDFFWRLLEPSPGRMRWAAYDAIVEAARDNGVAILGILDYSALWASRDPSGRDDKYPPRDPELFARYAEAVVGRYRGAVAYWEVWNEPDHGGFWKGSAEEYAALLARAYPRIKAANPAAQVLVGGLAQGGRSDPGFLDGLLAVCGRPDARCFDIFAFHTNFRTPADIERQFAENGQRLRAHGITAPVWITEASYTSDPRQQHVPGYEGGDDAQARYLVDTTTLSLKLGADRVFWATLYDYRKDAGVYTASGLRTVDGRAKPAYDAYRRLARGR